MNSLVPTKELAKCRLRLTVVFLLSALFGLASWSMLLVSGRATHQPQGPSISPVSGTSQTLCSPDFYLSAPHSRTVLAGFDPAVYTLTNVAPCVDTFTIEVASLNIIWIDDWTPKTVTLQPQESAQISVHFFLLADAGTLTDTIAMTSTSHMSNAVFAILTDTIVMPGSVFPPINWVYLPLISH